MVVYYFWYKNHSVPEPLDYEMVSPVPERLLDPIIEEPEIQENDDLFINPVMTPGEKQQGDGNAAPQGEPALPEDATMPHAQPMHVPDSVRGDPTTLKSTTQREKVVRQLPWLKKKTEGAAP
jgi:hypothetical protein